jgi:hypothetical protein
MSKVTNTAVVTACEQVLSEGHTYDEMDCQTAVEAVYVAAGLSENLVNLSGSNRHYRACYWTGTPERLCELIGADTVPEGCEVYIVLSDGGEVDKGYNDDYGNADHMGLYMGDGQTFNSSYKDQAVEISEKFDGYDTVPNGGWNMIGLKSYVDYGFSDAQAQAIMADANYVAENNDGETANESDDGTTSGDVTKVDTDDFYKVKKGCEGGAVRRLQRWINLLITAGRLSDIDPLEVDGDFGELTKEAVVSAQEQLDLEADGIVGPLTWDALAQALCDEGVQG